MQYKEIQIKGNISAIHIFDKDPYNKYSIFMDGSDINNQAIKYRRFFSNRFQPCLNMSKEIFDDYVNNHSDLTEAEYLKDKKFEAHILVLEHPTNMYAGEKTKYLKNIYLIKEINNKNKNPFMAKNNTNNINNTSDNMVSINTIKKVFDELIKNELLKTKQDAYKEAQSAIMKAVNREEALSYLEQSIKTKSFKKNFETKSCGAGPLRMIEDTDNTCGLRRRLKEMDAI